MSATEIIEQIKSLSEKDRAQVTKFVVEHEDSWIPKQGMAVGETGSFMDLKTAFAKWRGRGHLPTGRNTDDYLHLTRDANGS